MASARSKVISQLSIYRKQNLKYLEQGYENYVNQKRIEDLNSPQFYVNSLLPAYLTSLPPLILSILQSSRPTTEPKYEFRSTTLEDMSACNYNLDDKLERLEKIKNSSKKRLNHQQKAHYSTRSARKMRENKLPTDRITRAATLAGMLLNVASSGTKDAMSRCIRGEYKDILRNSLTSDEVIKHVVECLCKMRGTALKFGQLLSLQTDVLPEKFRQALISSRHEADVMNKEQVEKLLMQEFGEKWAEYFEEFDFTPMASASLGQVHRAKTKDGIDVAVKVQFPGILDSIDSDMDNLVWILTYTKIVPTNFFISQYAGEMRTEVMAECDYKNEARFYEIFRKLKLEGFHVPKVIEHLSTKVIITTEFVKGKPLEELKNLSDEVRNSVARRIMKLSLSEVFVYELMNTDPNPSNYLYDEETDLIGLVDFGSCRIYDRKFVEQYLKLVRASVREDYDNIMKYSLEVGFTHPEETKEVLEAHLDSINASAEPFKYDGEYDFSSSTIFTTIMDRSKIIFTKRKRPPPPEIYSLHRKLAGAFLISKILSAKYNSKILFDDIMEIVDSLNVK
ncbi:hypothetical protein MACJ_000067 [Theileria orientalis]|uniref:ABC1 atypical kinase-like domain-containing protein n=1 Tax=Theileria orientalis TaxID=68886 RepID=A0A976QR32_THEOR|nr:hypothetical protein MACJ_000067 [Theileria orientalis]